MGQDSITQFIPGIAWGIIWLLYLMFSNQVQEIIPQSFRRVYKIDWGILAITILLPLLCFIIGVYSINSKEDNDEKAETEVVDDKEKELKEQLENEISEEIKSKIRENLESKMWNKSLGDSERTDGRIIFSIPYGFACEPGESGNSSGSPKIYYVLSKESVGNTIVSSDYETEMTNDRFDAYWNDWEGEEDKKYPKRDVDGGKKTYNGHTCMYRIVKYNVNGVYVNWRFYLLFDKSTEKCCVVSAYDRNESADYIDDLLLSVRFK